MPIPGLSTGYATANKTCIQDLPELSVLGECHDLYTKQSKLGVRSIISSWFSWRWNWTMRLLTPFINSLYWWWHSSTRKWNLYLEMLLETCIWKVYLLSTLTISLMTNYSERSHKVPHQINTTSMQTFKYLITSRLLSSHKVGKTVLFPDLE